MTTTPVDLVEEAYRSWAAGDVVEAICAFDPAVRVHRDDDLPYARELAGRGEVAEMLRDILADWRQLEFTPSYSIAHDGVVAVVGTYVGELRRSGARREGAFAHLWFIEGGRSVELGLYRSPAAAMQALDEWLTRPAAERPVADRSSERPGSPGNGGLRRGRATWGRR